MKQARSFRGALSGRVRAESYAGRQYVVAPVVALVEGVIHASNAKAPELVLAAEFGKVPQGWDGRPLMFGHPDVNGAMVSANEPRVLETFRIGWVFHAEVKDEKLLMEAWFDPELVASKGEDAERLLSMVRTGQTTEVSVGVFVTSQPAQGVTADGKRYASVWREIIPDHLAALPIGMTGACSVEMGCGTPRAAQEGGGAVHKLAEKFKELVARYMATKEVKDAAEEDTGPSDSELRQKIEQALFASEPAFLGVVDVFPDVAKVVYATAPEGEVVFARRSYTVADDGAVSLSDDVEVGDLVQKFEPKAAAASPCGCGGHIEATAGKETTMDKKARVAAIIASGKTCFTSASAAALEALPEDELKALEAHVKVLSETPAPTPEPEPAVTPAPEPAADAPVEETPEQKDAAFYSRNPEVKEILEGHRAAQSAKRTSLTTRLLAAQKVYSEAELKAMSVASLEKLATAIIKEPVDFTGVGAPRAAGANDDAGAVPPPPDMHERIRNARKSA